MIPRAQTCFILLPGFSPDHQHLLGLEQSLASHGYPVIASNFFGNVVIDNFRNLTIEECQKNIAEIINDACSKYQQVIGIGISLGGALLLEHAKTKNNLYGIVSVGTPVRLKYRHLTKVLEFIVPIIHPLWWLLTKIKSFRLLPLGSGSTVIHYLENEFLQQVEKIKTPVLLLHSKNDSITDSSAVPDFFEKISSSHKELVFSENGGHAIDYDSEFIFNRLADFFDLQ